MIFPVNKVNDTIFTVSFLYHSLLKVILLPSSEVSDSVTETKPVDFISLSGVCLMNNRGTWKIQVCRYMYYQGLRVYNKPLVL